MTTLIQKWGNSLALRIPKTLAREVRLVEGEQVELQLTGEGLLVRPHHRKRYRLGELVAGIKPANRHAESDYGAPAGREAW
jgi:antitoxin MazE